MTAEIAILNKSAIALAADSAITIGDGVDAKIYNTVNKIFELSHDQPLAVMTYGNLEFMQLPIETIAKQYRHEVGNRTRFGTVAECAESFLDYLENRVPYSDVHEKINRLQLIDETFSGVIADIDKAILGEVRKTSKYLRSKSNAIAQRVIEKHIDRINQYGVSRCFSNRTDNKMLSGIEGRADDLVSNRFGKILHNVTKKTRTDAKRLARSILYREPLSDRRTGFVVAGFGEQEICPSLEWIETDAIVLRKLKYIHQDSVDIGRGTSDAVILPFAQDEMVARFLNGVDPTYDVYIHKRVAQSLRTFASRIVSALISDRDQQKAAIRSLAPIIESITQDLRSESLQHQVETYQKNVLSMVQFMPKQELANLAESLIDLTSLKRKVSHEKETVGGEVDVAVISKSEGLVWIKRKHYFPQDLNPRFFERHYARR